MKRIVSFFTHDIGRLGLKVAGITVAAIVGLVGILWLAAPLLPLSPEERAAREVVLSTIDRECRGLNGLDWVSCRSSVISFYAEPVCGNAEEALLAGGDTYWRYNDCFQDFLDQYDLALDLG